MKIAVIGGAGFIGNELAKVLKAQHPEAKLVCLDVKAGADIYDAARVVDVTNKAAMIKELNGIDVIYHLAAEHRDDVSPVQKYYDVNVGGAKNIVEAAEKHGIQTIIFTSTVAVYGLDAGESNEDDVPQPFNDYGTSKLESEEIFEQWAAGDQRNKLVSLRLVATFGAGNRGNIFTLMNQIARGKFVMIGDGANRKSIAYVGNVAAFLSYVLDSVKEGIHIFNYADKPDLSMRELVGSIRAQLGLKGLGPKLPYCLGLVGGKTFDLAAKATGRSFPISAIRVQKFCANTVVNADKAHGTDFEAPYSLEDGLHKMIRAEFKEERKAA
ncbi:NAD-dependent epimerase/dehydratase family protein [Alphaproteobacteria bacterium]|nr:NAD-dependent epimerase/dehydratase family protein [Alphaproteobacteria bacterium]